MKSAQAPSLAPTTRILQITPTSYARAGVIGGGERIVVYIDAALREAAEHIGARIETSVLALDGVEAAGHVGEHFQTIEGERWNPRSISAAALSARMRPADIVYVHQCLCEVGLFAAAHARLLGKRVFGSDAGAGEARVLASNPDVISVYDAVHALSQFAGLAFSGLPVPVHVVPGPVETALHRPPPPGTPARDPRQVISVGRILPHKGHERVIRALPPGMSLVIIGQHYDPDYLAFLQAEAAGKEVRFLDGLDDAAVRAQMHRAGVFVQASTHIDYRKALYTKPELLGLAPLEALACGMPTLVSDAGSLPELASLPGCRMFHSEAELSMMLADAMRGRPPAPSPERMHAAVDAAYGPDTVGRGLLAMMGIAPHCAS